MSIFYSTRQNHSPYAWVDFDTGITGNNPRVYVEKVARRGRVHLLYDSGGTSYGRYTDNDGGLWSSATSLGAGTLPCAIFSSDGSQAIYRLDGTDIKGIVRDSALNVYESSFTAFGSVTAGSRFSLASIPVQGGDSISLLAYVDSGIVKFRTSSNYLSWSSATSLESGAMPEVLASPDSTIRIYWASGTNLRGTVLDSSLATVEAIATVLSSIDSGASCAAAWTSENNGSSKVCMLTFRSSQLQEFSSVDGMTFI